MSLGHFQVAVIGGGPAAVSASVSLLRRGVSVCMLAVHPARSLAGEVLSPEACAAIEALGIPRDRLRFFCVPLYGFESKWKTETPIFHSFLTNPLGNGLVVDRRSFNLLLCAFAESAGLKVYSPARFLSAQNIQNRWSVDFQSDKSTDTIECDILIDSSGREAAVARYLGMARSRIDNLCGITAVMNANNTKQLLILEAVGYGWWYSVPIPNRRAMVCLLSDADIIRSLKAHVPSEWHNLLCELTSINSPGLAPAVLSTFPCETASLDTKSSPNFLAIGDALTSLDPLSSMGVLKAIQSGSTAAAAVVDQLNGDSKALARFHERELILYREYLLARQLQYSLGEKWKHEKFWERRQLARAENLKNPARGYEVTHRLARS